MDEITNMIAAGPVDKEKLDSVARDNIADAKAQTIELPEERSTVEAPVDESPTGDKELYSDDDFLKAMGQDDEGVKKETPKTATPEVKVETPATVKEEVKPVTPAPDETSTAIDYEKKIADLEKSIEDLETPATTQDDKVLEGFLKKMSKDAREYVVSREKKFKDLQKEYETFKATAPKEEKKSWVDHESAFILDPEYQKSVNASNQLNGVINHYKEQLVKIKDGEKQWEDVGIDAQGNYFRKPVTSDNRSEAEILSRLQEISMAKREIENRAQGIRQNFSSKVAEVKTMFRTMEDQFFPQYKDDVAASKNKHITTMREIFKAKGMPDTALNSLFTKMYAAYMEQDGYIKALETKVKSKAVAKEIIDSSGSVKVSTSSLPSDRNTDPQKVKYDENAFAAILGQ